MDSSIHTLPPDDRIAESNGHDPIQVERTNLLNVCKLIVKELIESSLKHGRMLDSDHVPLQHFFIVLEHVMRHGLKPKKGLLGPKKELWHVVEIIEKYAQDAHDITASVRQLPAVKTPVGRARAWLRLALMQKKLADYFKCLLDKRDELLLEFYEESSIMMCEEAIVIGGLLVGLNVIDCNLCLKEEDFDSPQGIIDFSLYLRDPNSILIQEGSEPNNMSTVLDQKNYIEELNRHLNATVTNLQTKVENFTTTNALMKEDLAIAKNHILQLSDENERLKQQLSFIFSRHENKTEEGNGDSPRINLDAMYNEMSKKLLEETQCRLELEKDMQQQNAMYLEMETAMKLLEKDIHEKQDTVVTLRRQLDDIKLINLEMFKKLQECETSIKHKTDAIGRLEEKKNQMAERIQQLEAKYGCQAFGLSRERLIKLDRDKTSNEDIARKLGKQLAEKDAKRTAIETDLKIEREWRTSLLESVAAEKDKMCDLQVELAKLKVTSDEYEKLKFKYDKLQRTCDEHTQTLEELATHLGESKLKMEDLKEFTRTQKEAVWLSDKEATNCRQCNKEFSIARRRHHCRHCGEIFCHSCSDTTMPLPSSAKPVRVCDSCHTVLLHRYQTQSTA
uniref:RUN and FYVE domain-containing protein 2 n=1 Tax=Strigamia maritima TaxID=126957 RepID=T1IKM3_STRMM